MDEEIRSMNYFKEIYDFVGMPKNDSLFRDFHERVGKIENEESSYKQIIIRLIRLKR